MIWILTCLVAVLAPAHSREVKEQHADREGEGRSIEPRAPCFAPPLMGTLEGLLHKAPRLPPWFVCQCFWRLRHGPPALNFAPLLDHVAHVSLSACWCTDAPHLIRLASRCMHSPWWGCTLITLDVSFGLQ